MCIYIFSQISHTFKAYLTLWHQPCGLFALRVSKRYTLVYPTSYCCSFWFSAGTFYEGKYEEYGPSSTPSRWSWFECSSFLCRFYTYGFYTFVSPMEKNVSLQINTLFVRYLSTVVKWGTGKSVRILQCLFSCPHVRSYLYYLAPAVNGCFIWSASAA